MIYLCYVYKEYSPCSVLTPFIYHFWEYKGETRNGLKFNIPPHGCSDFVFIVGNAVDCIKDSLIMKPCHSYFFGPMNTFTESVAHTNFIHTIGICFCLCGLFRFTDIPLNELTNQRIDSHEFPVLFSQPFIYQLCESNQDPIDAIEHELVRQVYKNNTDIERQISYAVSSISRQRGIISIKELATEACLGLRQLERKFKFYTGYLPKEYNWIVKFWNVTHLLKSNISFDSFLSVAIQAGYHDTPHLYREVKRLSGSTPNAFLSLLTSEEVEVLRIEL